MRLDEPAHSYKNVGLRTVDHVHPQSVIASLLEISNVGILITDLEHTTLAVNGRFGQIFRVDPLTVPWKGVEELRRVVYPRLKQPEQWASQLDEVYADPEAARDDEFELLDDCVQIIRRSTFPLRSAGGVAVGRVWTFEDITEDRMRGRRMEAMQAVSAYHHTDPNLVLRFIVGRIAEIFESTCILSIWKGDKMIFREVANMPAWLPELRENQVKDSYCQIALRTVKPLRVQNAALDDFCRQLPPALMGLTRYAGVPITGARGEAIGTLCLLDGNSSVPITSEDMEFLSVMGHRVSTEMERERIYEERLAEQKRLVERQDEQLRVTREVLAAMNGGFELLAKPQGNRELMEGQALLLSGLLGYQAAAVAQISGTDMVGVAACRGLATPFQVAIDQCGSLKEAAEAKAGEFQHLKTPNKVLRQLLQSEYLTLAILPTDALEPYLVLMGTAQPPPLDDEHHATHLLALIDQVALAIIAANLHDDLRQAHRELQDAQNRLIQSEKLSVVGALSASIAHDIRNILASISIECSLEEQDPAAVLERLRCQIERFSVLSHRLLSYARPRFLARETVDVNEIVERAVAMLATQARVSGVSVSLALEPELPTVLADSHRVEHLFVNLMLNALQAVSSQGGQLTVRTARIGPDLIATVQDNGRGMDSETARRVFEPFYSTRNDGFGLGLYSCRKIVDEQGWTLTVVSEPGQGSTFAIRIPLERTNA